MFFHGLILTTQIDIAILKEYIGGYLDVSTWIVYTVDVRLLRDVF